MSLFHPVDNRSPTLGICMRCNLKKQRYDLKSDPNSPGMLVCRTCSDELDPYRKPQRNPEDITVKRPITDEVIDA